MKKLILISFLSWFLLVSFSQNPLNEYMELPNPKPTNTALWASVPSITLSWGDTDTRYIKNTPYFASNTVKSITLTAWKGEQIASQFVISTKSNPLDISYSVSDLVDTKDQTKTISSDNIFTGFVRYVMTDELNKDGKGACGNRVTANFDSSLVADPIDHITKTLRIQPMNSQGIWVRVNIPQTATEGIYAGEITVNNGSEIIGKLNLRVRVINQTLPSAGDRTFHLDLWQNPFAVARYYQVPLWSAAHLDALKKEHKLYADAGGKVITASIIHDPWNSQTYDVYQTMVKWTKKTNGSWDFDFTVFDTWVQLMMDLGVDNQINCYSMIPWKLSFRYFDETTQTYKDAVTAPGDALYEEMWVAMLKSFAAHLKEKGWFEKTYISMDERPMDQMLKTLAVIRKADANYKVSLAGALHSELINELDDYCVALRMKYTDEMLATRKAAGRVTTYYTSCEEPFPNTFTFSQPPESEWLAWYAAKAGLDGYLRWALNCWVKQPLLDSRFRSWAAGDTYMIYPNGRTSIRFERLNAGIQAYEKVKILRAQFQAQKDIKLMNLLDDVLKNFDENNLTSIPAATVVSYANKMINGFNSPYDMLQAAIEQAVLQKNSVKSGSEPGFYSAENINLFQTQITNAETIRDNSLATEEQWWTAAENLIKQTTDFRSNINMPLASTEGKTYWYSLSTPLRTADGRNYISYQGVNAALTGEAFTANTPKFLWKITANGDGSFNLISRAAETSFISPNSAFNTPLKSQIGVPASGGWVFKPVYTNNLFAIVSGTVQMNQTNSGLGYKIYNWGGGNEMADTGCQYLFRTEEIKTSVSGAKFDNTRIWVENGYIKTNGNIEDLQIYKTDGSAVNVKEKQTKGIILVKTPLSVKKIVVE